MTKADTPAQTAAARRWLQSYYLIRAAVSGVWVAAAFLVGTKVFAVAAVLLVLYPWWDAVANSIDAQRNGGFPRNHTQALNAIVSVLTGVGVVIALMSGMNAVLGVYGVWAVLAGLLQLLTGVRRWKAVGAQWAMVLSGGQSAVVGILFVSQALAPSAPTIADIAPYAGLGAFYFLISAVWLFVSSRRRAQSDPQHDVRQ